jgi:hypothetical protein
MAQATAVVAFTSASGIDSKAFTWTPQLTSNPPKVQSVSVVGAGGGQGPCSADLPAAPTNVGGTVRISSPTDCTVTLVASD